MTAFRTTAKAIAEAYPDFTEEMAMFVVNNRDPLERDMKSAIVDEITHLFKKLPEAKKRGPLKNGICLTFWLSTVDKVQVSFPVLSYPKSQN